MNNEEIENIDHRVLPAEATVDPSMSSRRYRKKLVIILSLIAIAVVAIGVYVFTTGMEKRPVNTLYGDSLSPEARKEMIIRRVSTADTQPLTPDELRYIFNWVASGDGRKFNISPQEKAKIIKAINS